MTEWSGYGYVEATRKAQDRNYWQQLIASDPAMDGEHNRVVRMWLCGGNKEGTRQELLAANHYIRQWANAQRRQTETHSQYSTSASMVIEDQP